MNIVLIGMPGSGKTTIGKVLSKKTGRILFDSDEEIEKKEKMTINEIFENGENYFRQLEHETLKKLLKNRDSIISTGGGVVENTSNFILLKKEFTIFLDRSVNDILQDIEVNNRPLLKGDYASKLIDLEKRRRSKYIDLANSIVQVYSIKDTINDIMSILKKEGIV